MVENDSLSKEIMQTCFDLLAEVVKFNIEAFKIIEDVLKTTEIVSKQPSQPTPLSQD